MRTRQTKLAEEAAESDQKLESNADGEEAMNVNVIPEELTLDALKGLTQNRNKYETTEASKTDTDSFGLLNMDSDSISAADQVGKNDDESPADGAPIQREEATHTSVARSCEDTTIDASISDSVSIATVETENDASGLVRTEGGTSSSSSVEVRKEEGSTSDTLPVPEGASGSTKMEGTSTITSSTVDRDPSKMELISNESTAKPSICSPEKSTVAEEMSADAQILDELLKDSIQTEENASSSSLTIDRNTSNIGETSQKSIGSGGTPKPINVSEVCVLTKSKGNSKPLEGELDEKTREEIRARHKVFKEKTAEFRIIGRRFCEERKIAFPNKRTFRNLVYDLDQVQKLDEENLKIVLEARGQQKRDSSSADPNKTVASATSEGKTDGGYHPEGVGELSKSSAKSLVDSEFENRQRKRAEVESRYNTFKLIAHEYCAANQCLPPSRKIFESFFYDLLNKNQLDEKNLKSALDKHIKLTHCRVESERFKQVGCKAQKSPAVAIVDAKKDEILPSVVKPFSEMTPEERIAFLKEFRIMHIKMKPVAIKHCHTIKSPFPQMKIFWRICRRLFEAGMLDEENLKLAIEMDFDKRCNGSLTDEQLCLILKHYCADNGIRGYSIRRMKNEMLPKVPQTLLTPKHYWALMHKDRKTNLFTDENLADPETIRLLMADLKRDNSKLAASQPAKPPARQPAKLAASQPAKPPASQSTKPAASRPTPSRQQNHAAPCVQKNDATIRGNVEPRLRLSGAAKRKLHRSNMSSDSLQNEKLHAMGLPWSNSKQNMGREHKRGPWSVWDNGASSSSYTSPNLRKFSQGLNEEPIQQFLVQTNQWVAEKAQMLGGGQNSWGSKNSGQPKNSETRKLPYWGGKQEQWGKGKDKAQPSSSNSFGIRGVSQPQIWGQGAMNVPNQTNFLGRIPNISTLVSSVRSVFSDPDSPAQNLIPNIRAPGRSSAQPAWPLRSENISFGKSDIRNDDYSQNSGLGEQSRNRGAVFGHNLGCDPLEGTSDKRWSERERFDPPRKNMTDWDTRSSPNQQGQSRWKIHDNDWRCARDAPHDNDGRFTRDAPHDNDWRCARDALHDNDWRFTRDAHHDNDWRCARDALHDNDGRFTRDAPHDNDWRCARDASHDDDWRSTRDAPPQKKFRFDEDRQPQRSRSSHLECVTNDFDDWMAKNTKQSSEHMNPSTSSRKNWGRASPPRTLMSKTSEMPTVNEIPPFVETGKTCKVAIVHEDYPRRWLTDQEAELIRSALLDCIGRHSGVAAPRFTDTYEERGAVIFECEDQLTVSWFWLNASTLTPWRSAKLRTTSWEKPPKEISIEVPKLLQSLTPLALCERLMSQNPGLSTGYWKLKSADITKGQNLVFNIDDESMETLKSLDFRPYLGFSRAKIHINRE